MAKQSPEDERSPHILAQLEEEEEGDDEAATEAMLAETFDDIPAIARRRDEMHEMLQQRIHQQQVRSGHTMGHATAVVRVPAIPHMDFEANRQAWLAHEQQHRGAVNVARETDMANRQVDRKPAAFDNNNNNNNSNGNGNGFSKGGGNTRYTDQEVEALMDNMEDILPIGKHEWERLTERCNSDERVAKHRHRGLDNLRKQHNANAKKKAPTGDPDCPPMVRKAKQIRESIRLKAGSATMNNAANDLPAYVHPAASNGSNATSVAAIVTGNNNHTANCDGNKTKKNDTNNPGSGSRAPRRLVGDNTSEILKA